MDLLPQPGINKDDSELAAKNTWTDCDLVRFRRGMPEPIGGWTKMFTTTLNGKCRGAIAWRDNDGELHFAFGTSKKLYIFKGGTLTNITPIRSSFDDQSVTIATVDGSAVVTITHSSHGAIDGDTVIIDDQSAALNNIDLSGGAEYTITYVDSDNYKVTASTTADATGSDTRTLDLDYEINIGQDNQTFGLGWGAGGWGEETWGTPRTASGVVLDPRIWSLDTFGEDLLASPLGGTIYFWDTSAGVATRAVVISNAPDVILGGIAVSDRDRHIMAFGADLTGSANALEVSWSDAEDKDTWTPGATNSAGDNPFANASKILRGLAGPGEMLIWTDKTLVAMPFSGPPFVFDQVPQGEITGLIAPNAAIIFEDVAYWMGPRQFFRYAGRIQPMLSPVWKYVYNGLTTAQVSKICAGTVQGFNEVWFFYPRDGATENNAYVGFNTHEEVWFIGMLPRTVWVDKGAAGSPFAVDPTNDTVYWHESGKNADGDAMEPYIESGYHDLDTTGIKFLKEIIPDIAELSGEVNITVTARLYPHDDGANEISKQRTITSTAKILKPRLRGRDMKFKLSSMDLDAFWRLGRCRVEFRAAGGR